MNHCIHLCFQAKLECLLRCFQALTSASVKLGKYYDAYLAAKYNCQNATFDVKFDSKLQASLFSLKAIRDKI